LRLLLFSQPNVELLKHAMRAPEDLAPGPPRNPTVNGEDTGRFSPLSVSSTLQGFEACTAYGEKLASGAFVVPVGASSVIIDAHVRPLGKGHVFKGNLAASIENR
jgi:hypothetical protein